MELEVNTVKDTSVKCVWPSHSVRDNRAATVHWHTLYLKPSLMSTRRLPRDSGIDVRSLCCR